MPSGVRPDREVAAARAGGGFTGGKIAEGRPSRSSTTGTITPKYGWDQARMSDFGILGGVGNMFSGIMAGNTYAGRTPQGFVGSRQRDLGAMGPGAVGNTGGKSMFMPGGMDRMEMMQQMAAQRSRQQHAAKKNAMTAVTPALAQPKPMSSAPSMFMGTGGKFGYGLQRPGYQFYGPGSI